MGREKLADQRVDLLLRHFFIRKESVLIPGRGGRGRRVDLVGPLLDAVVAHVQGEASPPVQVRAVDAGAKKTKGSFRLGSYVPSLDGLTPWLCVDLDGGDDHSTPLADPLHAALTVLSSFHEHGISANLEKSGGGQGWHVWVFFEQPVSAQSARRVAFAVIGDEVLRTDGSMTGPRENRGVEVFPKKDSISPNGFGNAVWCPWFHGAEGDANQFHRVLNDDRVEPFMPERFETVSEEKLLRVLEGLPQDDEEQPASFKESAKAGPWRAWRSKALAALPLNEVYGEWLTGKRKSNGWLECRDPESPSGDQAPSAGVADTTDQAERGLFHSFITSKKLSVFDFVISRGRAEDFRAACQLVADLAEVPLPRGIGSSSNDGRPRIRTNGRQLTDILKDAWTAVLADNEPPVLFQRGGTLARIKVIDERWTIESMDRHGVYGHLARVAHWYALQGETILHRRPPRDLGADFLAYPNPELPFLDEIVHSPVFDAEGILIGAPGYHQSARLWYEPQEGFEFEPSPSPPTQEEALAARDFLLKELLVDFRFADVSDQAHALAALLLPFVRRMIEGCTPIHLIEAPVQGSGKGLFADIISIISSGESCEVATIGKDEKETRKRITALLIRGTRIVLFDNVRVKLDSSSFAAALTAETWSDRILGQSRVVTLPNRTTWLLTANNPQVSGEMARRCIRIRIDPQVEQPWKRKDFRHDPLREWVRENRVPLVTAIVTIVRRWVEKGSPASKKRLGSFEAWAEKMGGILESVEIEGFLENQDDLYAGADEEVQEWAEFAPVWWSELKGEWCPAATIAVAAKNKNMLMGIRGEDSERSQSTRVGRALRLARQRVIGGYRIEDRFDEHRKARSYRLVPVDHSMERLL